MSVRSWSQLTARPPSRQGLVAQQVGIGPSAPSNGSQAVSGCNVTVLPVLLADQAHGHGGAQSVARQIQAAAEQGAQVSAVDSPHP